LLFFKDILTVGFNFIFAVGINNTIALWLTCFAGTV